ncbi:MAG: hypothetical protein IRZ00_11305 [Gemmatimonadetes bacterium]|nr:hypothetical protein [Gemmatimonadota bacterium]
MAAALAGWSWNRARLLDPTPEAAAVHARPSIGIPPRVTIRSERLDEAVAQDPFRADRRPAPLRFAMPGDAPPPPAAPAGGPPPRPPLALVATSVLSAGKGFAMLAVGDQPPRMVRVGDTLGGVRLRDVGRGKVTVVYRGSVIVLEMRGPGGSAP